MNEILHLQEAINKYVDNDTIRNDYLNSLAKINQYLDLAKKKLKSYEEATDRDEEQILRLKQRIAKYIKVIELMLDLDD